MRVFHPISPQAAAIDQLFYITLWVCAFIMLAVVSAITVILFRYARRGRAEPAPSHGNKKIEIVWTAIPLLILGGLFTLTFITAGKVNAGLPASPDIVVTGHQWWWEVYYPAANFRTANEIHIPAGQDVVFLIKTADVIHDFWAPELGRKIDAVPTMANYLRVRAVAPGTWLGACSEFCGQEHAYMRFRVVVEPRRRYEEWRAIQQAPAFSPASGGNAAQGAQKFQDLTCANCHNIAGTKADARYGPDLTHFGSRAEIGAEKMRNTPENLARWLQNPQAVKPGIHMPDLRLSKEDVEALTTYLEALK